MLPPELRYDLQNFDAGLAGFALDYGWAEDDGITAEPASKKRSSLRRELKQVELAKGLAAESNADFAAMDAFGVERGAAARPGSAAPAPVAATTRGLKSEAKNEATLERLEKLVVEEEAESLGELAQLADKETAFSGRRRLSNKPVEDELRFAGQLSGGAQSRFSRSDRELREQVRQFYRKLDQTKEWAENNYYHLPIEQQNADLVKVSKFWNDYASRDPESPFYSRHIGEAARSFSEMMFALAVLDLPFESSSGEGSTNLDGNTLTMTPSTPVILFHKEIREAAASGQATQLLVSQNFFREGDRFVDVDGERRDKFVTDEFLAGVVYGCQIVVTNPTSSTQRLDLLQQIPVGAIPVNGSKATANSSLRLGAYQTHTQGFHFYFPKAGEYAHYPVHVSKDGKVVAFAESFIFNVVEELSVVDTTSWAHVSQWGTDEQVLEYLKENNLRQIDLGKIAWRCRESDVFFKNAVEILDGRHHYHPVLFSYGIHHNQLQPMRQYLLHADRFLSQCGSYIDTKLVTIDPVERKDYQHLEYSPLVNARSYALGGTRKILNDRFRNQYQQLMKIFSYREALDSADQLTLTYYLFLQDRIEEALDVLASIDRKKLNTQLQYDYLKAYAAFFQEDPGEARAIADKYADYPVERWQNVFLEVVSQVNEIEGKAPENIDEEDRNQQQNLLASTEPGFTFKVENRSIDLVYRNLKDVTVNYYRMDLEFLFSTNPFVSSDSARFSMIKPNRSDRVALNSGKESMSFALPDEFEGENVLVEVVGAGIRKAQAYYSNTLDVQLAQNYGQLRVTETGDSGKGLSRVYVKVYAEIDGASKFYKDGYTDLRGKFDYASLNTSELSRVSRFSILVMSEENGALVQEARPPQM